jgi:hypothetical protein
MNRKYLSIASIVIILTLAACGPALEPTLSADDLANTAIAQAWAAVTLTQAAIPTATATPIPPTPTLTFTPLPTFTPVMVSPIAPATLVDTSATDPCNEPPPYEPKGILVKVKFVNKSGGNVNLAFGMTEKNSLGECGTYTFTLGTYDEPVVTVLAGCYWGYGWVTGKTPSTAKTIDFLCVTDPNQVPAIWIGPEVISFH